ncbi:UDP-glucoronosyl and UDP-glucosyl transferase domain-containing protein [Ditylenchus destructor]|uniref:glucuronosyltransferase n=1 Tax=Ditylenchus destructor TaxID=166010 RepID=A0AAD4RE31_9BILA|nr:UDP-glucoronosyl and UDP-glucosyl transferase domain-containing protein [Ditylenchus destructor]
MAVEQTPRSLCSVILFYILCAVLPCCNSLKILQIVPGFTNSHVLFNYRLSETLISLGHEVRLWTQMEMNMVFTGDFVLPPNVTELRIPIVFKDTLKTEGLKVFQSMMFNRGSAYDLWWTGQEFKDMRDEQFDLAIGHFHDLCPLALAKKVGVGKVIWITHGTSVYDFTAVQIGLRTFPAFVPHPLSSCGDRMDFSDRVINFLWHMSTLDFVNLPENLLREENEMYKREFIKDNEPDLWELSQNVDVLLVNGERFLDFPRPLPMGIAFLGQVGHSKKHARRTLPTNIEEVYARSKKGVVIFSLGTVSNTTNMPDHMAQSFVEGFARFPEYDFIWKTEMHVSEADMYQNIHLMRWIPQKELMKHPKTKLLIAHGGYNSFLEASQAGLPIVLMPLFADQFINAERARRFGIVEVLDKLNLSAEIIASAISKVLGDPRYAKNAIKLGAMLSDKPSDDQYAALKYSLKLATVPRPHFALKAAQKLNIVQFYNYDLILPAILCILLIAFK